MRDGPRKAAALAAISSQALLDVEARAQGLGTAQLGVAVTQLDAGFEAPVEVGHQAHIAFFGQTLGHVAHELVEAEHVVQRAPGPVRCPARAR